MLRFITLGDGCIVAGLALIVCGAALWSVPAGFLVAGIALVVTGAARLRNEAP